MKHPALAKVLLCNLFTTIIGEGWLSLSNEVIWELSPWTVSIWAGVDNSKGLEGVNWAHLYPYKSWSATIYRRF